MSDPTENQKSRGSRIPPHSIEAEEALLGAMLLSPDAIESAADLCEASDFYRPSHGHIFAALCDLRLNGREADWVTVQAKMKDMGHPVDPATLTSLQLNTPTASSAPHYAEIVRDRSRQRRLIAIGGEILDDSYAITADVDGLVDKAERLVMSVRDQGHIDTAEHIGPLTIEAIGIIENRKDGEPLGVDTGYLTLDEILNGLSPTSLTIIGARPSVGKTAFALGIAQWIGIVRNLPVLYFSLEMSRLELTERILASQAEVDSVGLKNGNLSDDDWNRVQATSAKLIASHIYLDDNPSLTVMDVRARARRLKQERGTLGCIVVDYLQLMSTKDRGENRQVEVSAISRSLKVLARELECPVIALSQLSRGLESRAEKAPILSDLRESGSLEQDADVVLLIHRKELDAGNAEVANTDRGYVEIIVAKHRNGPVGKAELVFRSKYAKFDNMGQPDSTFAADRNKYVAAHASTSAARSIPADIDDFDEPF